MVASHQGQPAGPARQADGRGGPKPERAQAQGVRRRPARGPKSRRRMRRLTARTCIRHLHNRRERFFNALRFNGLRDYASANRSMRSHRSSGTWNASASSPTGRDLRASRGRQPQVWCGMFRASEPDAMLERLMRDINDSAVSACHEPSIIGGGRYGDLVKSCQPLPTTAISYGASEAVTPSEPLRLGKARPSAIGRAKTGRIPTSRKVISGLSLIGQNGARRSGWWNRSRWWDSTAARRSLSSHVNKSPGE